MFNLSTQPMTLGDSISNTFKLWRATLVSVLPLSVIISVISEVPMFFVKQPTELENPKTLYIYLTMSFVVALITIIPKTAMLACIGHAIHNQKITLSQAFAVGIVKYRSVLAWFMIWVACTVAAAGILYLVYLLSGVITFLLSLLLFALLISVVIYFLCVPPLIVLKNMPVLKAIEQSFQMTKNHWWFGAWLLTLVTLVIICTNLLAGYLLGAIGSLIISCLTIPLQSCMVIVFYEHLKSRAASPPTIAP